MKGDRDRSSHPDRLSLGRTLSPGNDGDDGDDGG
jgi:hypothetical protein